MKVYLNPGHDRCVDAGAVNQVLGLRECDVAYELACSVAACLERNGVVVLMGQQDDLYVLCGEANEWGADLFVSIHFNAFNKRASGTETLVSGSAASLLLGCGLQSNVKAVLGLPDRGLKERPGLFVLHNTAMPAAVLEVCFIDNDCDMRRYGCCRDDVAAAIATAIMQYFGLSGREAA